jgi:hypothetical protein
LKTSDVRAIFDAGIGEYEAMSFYPKADATIVHSREFESGIVKRIHCWVFSSERR